MQISATSADDYLNQLPEERRAIVSTVRDVIVKNLPYGYRETTRYGMIAYEIPLEHYPNTYNKQPLMYAALAAQKNDYVVYLMQTEEQRVWLEEQFAEAGKKLKMGKSCLHFKKLADLPLDVIGQSIASVTLDRYIAHYERVMNDRKTPKEKK